MALEYADRVAETTTTTGTGTYSLAGAKAGFRGFVAGVGTGNTCYYCVTDGTDWEVGLGTVTDASPDTLSRDSIEASSNGGAAVNWGAGTKDVFLTVPASQVGGGTSDHGALTGLSDDDHGQYALLAGRSGGQTLRGGTGASEHLKLRSTSHATKGKVMLLYGETLGFERLQADGITEWTMAVDGNNDLIFTGPVNKSLKLTGFTHITLPTGVDVTLGSVNVTDGEYLFGIDANWAVRVGATLNFLGADYGYRWSGHASSAVNRSWSFYNANLAKHQFVVVMGNGRTFQGAPNTAPTDSHLAAGQVSFYLNESTHKLHVRVKYADGTTLKTGEVALA